MTRILLIAAALAVAATAQAEQKVVKDTLTTGGEKRTYYLFVPDSAAGKPAPLLVLLHGSGRNGKSLVDPWQSLAKKEGVVLVAPDSRKSEEWHIVPDGPHFVYDVIEAVKAKHPIDVRRMYLFGHSGGAIQGLHLAVLESEYFAAAAAHAGVITEDFAPFVDKAPRKIPIAIWVGTNDNLFPLAVVRGTRDALNSRGFAAELTEIPGHTHRYYDRAAEINKQVWAFFQKHQLAAEPKYQVYAIPK